MILPTVTIEARNKWGYRIINEADFDPKVHKLFNPNGAPPVVEPSNDDLPADWKDLHWKRQVAIARQLTGKQAANAAEAAALIEAHIKQEA